MYSFSAMEFKLPKIDRSKSDIGKFLSPKHKSAYCEKDVKKIKKYFFQIF